MAFVQTVETVITSINADTTTLQSLLGQTASETLIADTSVSYSYPAIAYNDANDSWTLTQTTPDSADGLYKGLFTLGLPSACARLTVLSHNVVTPDDNIPARYQACGATTLTNAGAIATLNDKRIKKLEVRSKQPFSISLKLNQATCFTFEPDQRGQLALRRIGNDFPFVGYDESNGNPAPSVYNLYPTPPNHDRSGCAIQITPPTLGGWADGIVSVSFEFWYKHQNNAHNTVGTAWPQIQLLNTQGQEIAGQGYFEVLNGQPTETWISASHTFNYNGPVSAVRVSVAHIISIAETAAQFRIDNVCILATELSP